MMSDKSLQTSYIALTKGERNLGCVMQEGDAQYQLQSQDQLKHLEL